MFWNSVNPPKKGENCSLLHSLLHTMVSPLISHSVCFHISINLNHITSTTNTPLSWGLKRKTKVITDVSNLLLTLFWGMKRKFGKKIYIYYIYIYRVSQEECARLQEGVPYLNTLATGYGDFRTSVAKRRRRATKISVFPNGWMEDGVGFVMC